MGTKPESVEATVREIRLATREKHAAEDKVRNDSSEYSTTDTASSQSAVPCLRLLELSRIR
jgi:hypothetical protein